MAKKKKKITGTELKKLILKAVTAARNRFYHINSYSGPSPDEGRESASLTTTICICEAVLSAMDGDLKPLKEIGKIK
jgi:hypothetical protein